MASIQPEQIFIPPTIMAAASPFRLEDQLELLSLYLSIAVKLHLYGKDVAANLHASAFRKAVRQLNSYRVSSGRDSEFRTNAEAWKLSGLDAMGCPDGEMLSPAILGILCSKVPEDLSAAFTAMRRYSLSVDPTQSPPRADNPDPGEIRATLPGTLHSFRRADIERRLPPHVAPVISTLSQQLDINGQEDAADVIAVSEIIPLLQMLKDKSDTSIGQQKFEPADNQYGQSALEPEPSGESDAPGLKAEKCRIKGVSLSDS